MKYWLKCIEVVLLVLAPLGLPSQLFHKAVVIFTNLFLNFA